WYDPDPKAFFTNCDVAEEAVKQEASLEDNPERDDYLFVTSIPWIHFTSFQHPINVTDPDSVPRISWGKFVKEGERVWLPLSMQAHHALVDGWHMGQFFQEVEKLFLQPEICLERLVGK
ncbi:MAG: CatA-like O-acetyltransferase, partial [Bacteroidota bacterium]